MAESITILGIAGSLRRTSYNKSALRAAQGLCPQGATLEIFGLEGIPLFNQDEERNPPKQVIDLKARVRAADAILLVTPEYNYSIPGVLKNAIDWASRPYGDSVEWKSRGPYGCLGRNAGNRSRSVSPEADVCVFEYVSGEPTGGHDQQCSEPF